MPNRLVTKSHRREIGNIIVEWAMLEDLMGLAVGALLCGNARAVERHIVAAQMDYRHRRDALNAYSDLLDPGPLKEEFVALMRDIETMAKLRDMAAHGTWVRGRKRGTIKPLSFRARGGTIKLRGHQHNEPNYTADSLEEIAVRVAPLYARLHTFVGKVGRALFPDDTKISKRRDTRSRTS